MGVQVMETTFKGPLPKDTMGLIIGRASTAMRGLTVIPGVVDSDYTGQVRIMAQTLEGTMVVNEGDKIAQLLLLPSLHAKFPSKSQDRGHGSFGSTGEIFEGLHLTLETRPMLSLTVNGKNIMGLLDTGADRSIISERDWPSTWPTNTADNTLQGQGIIERAHRSLKELLRKQKGGVGHGLPPKARLSMALLTYNFLNLNNHNHSPAMEHCNPSPCNKGWVKWKDVLTGQWHGPDPVLSWTRGAVCVFPQEQGKEPVWVPERLVRPVEQPASSADGQSPDRGDQSEHDPSGDDAKGVDSALAIVGDELDGVGTGNRLGDDTEGC